MDGRLPPLRCKALRGMQPPGLRTGRLDAYSCERQLKNGCKLVVLMYTSLFLTEDRAIILFWGNLLHGGGDVL
jgi:hypothetical protein